ncbi:hypothetical protein T484DRAFT_1762711, partial [Baffinella frigidus]
ERARECAHARARFIIASARSDAWAAWVGRVRGVAACRGAAVARGAAVDARERREVWGAWVGRVSRARARKALESLLEGVARNGGVALLRAWADVAKRDVAARTVGKDHAEEVRSMREEHEAKVTALGAEIRTMGDEHKVTALGAEIRTMGDEHKDEVRGLKVECDVRVREMEEAHAEKAGEMGGEMSAMGEAMRVMSLTHEEVARGIRVECEERVRGMGEECEGKARR